jgi:hypothetical protein
VPEELDRARLAREAAGERLEDRGDPGEDQPPAMGGRRVVGRVLGVGAERRPRLEVERDRHDRDRNPERGQAVEEGGGEGGDREPVRQREAVFLAGAGRDPQAVGDEIEVEGEGPVIARSWHGHRSGGQAAAGEGEG